MKKYLLAASLLINFMVLIGGLYAVHRMGGFKNVINKIKDRGIANTYEHRANLFEMLPIQEGDIVFLGNSLTAQNEWAEMFNNPKIKNRGIPGDHAAGILARLGPIISAKPAKIFLMVGINDLAYHPPSVVIEKIGQLIDAIQNKAPATKLYLQSILPINDKTGWFDFNNSDIQTVNEAIREMAVSKNLAYIDIYPLLLDEDGSLDTVYTRDGIHINGLAYLKWKQAIETHVY